MTEAWKDVVGYEGRYQVSDLGRVRSLPNPTRSTTRLLKFGYDNDGYAQVALYNGTGKSSKRKVHLLVAEAFIGPRPHGLVCCHEDDDRSNIRASNLRWDTISSNGRDAVRNGVAPIGERNGGGGKLDDTRVAGIKRRLRMRERHSVLAREHGVSQVLIGKIATGKLWKHIS